MDLRKKIIEADGERLVCELSLKDRNAVILHGAGTSSRRRYYAVAEEFYRAGLGVVLFDFAGHGESSGNLNDQSLARRQIQAEAVIDGLVPPDSPLYLCGFSMGAQTVCDLLLGYGPRTEALLLGCPAVYAADVQGLRFGDASFTKRLREPGSWASSGAPKSLSGFGGKTVIAIGGHDEVIPEDVVDLLKKAAVNLEFKRYEGATHKLAAWLEDHPEELAELIREVTR